MSKTEEVEFHEYANIFPLMSNTDLEKLAKDIKKNGLLEPIILYKEKILDGRNRFLACKKAKIEPIYRIFNRNMDPIEYIISKNLKRRHLTSAQKAESAKKALDYKRQIREKQFKQLKGDIDESIKVAVDIKDKKNIAQTYHTTPKKMDQYEKIENEISKGNKEIEEDWEKAKKGKKTSKEVYEETLNNMEKKTQKLRKDIITYKFLFNFVKERCLELGYWKKIFELYHQKRKNNEPTIEQLRKAELI